MCPSLKIGKPIQEREVFIVGRAAFLSLFLLLFSLVFLLLREAKLRRNGGKPAGFSTDIDGAFVAGFGKGVFF